MLICRRLSKKVSSKHFSQKMQLQAMSPCHRHEHGEHHSVHAESVGRGSHHVICDPVLLIPSMYLACRFVLVVRVCY